MSKDNRSALVPKAYATFSDALEEAAVEAARQIVGSLMEAISREFQGEKETLGRKLFALRACETLDTAPVYAEVADIVTKTVRDSIGERFHFVEAKEE